MLQHIKGTENTLMALASPMQAASSSSSLQSNQSIVYIGGESQLALQKEQVSDSLKHNNIIFQENNPETATHFILLITDSFLKSKEILPLINRFNTDPHF